MPFTNFCDSKIAGSFESFTSLVHHILAISIHGNKILASYLLLISEPMVYEFTAQTTYIIPWLSDNLKFT